MANQIANNTDLKQSLFTGSIILKNPSQHQFRDRIQQLELDQENPGITVKNFLTSKARASQAEINFIQNHLERDEFSMRLPNKNMDYWLRVRELSKERQEMRFGMGFRTENEKIINQIQKNTVIDHATKNNKMIHFPQWKTNQKQKWISTDDFNNKTLLYQGPRAKDDCFWEVPPIQSQIHQVYEDGLNALGDKLSQRERIKSLEKNEEFISTIKKDTWEDTLIISKSIRTLKGDKNFQAPDSIDLYSTLDKSKSLKYKDTLIKTKSVDRMIPFKHSQNKNGIFMNNLRPVMPKIYKNSLKQYDLLTTMANTMNSGYDVSLNPVYHEKAKIPVKETDNFDSSHDDINSRSQFGKSQIQQDTNENEKNPKNKFQIKPITEKHSKHSTVSNLLQDQNQEQPQFMKKNYLPWEQPSQNEISNYMNKYFFTQKSRPGSQYQPNSQRNQEPKNEKK